MRTKVIAGNWKMNKTPLDTAELVAQLREEAQAADCEVVVCVPFTSIAKAVEAAKGSRVAVGAQNMYFEDKGAYTGEISADMLKAAGVSYVVLGHSERRQYFGETDGTVNAKTIKALEKGLIPIVCVGESLPQRESGITSDVICMQVKLAMQGISPEDAKGVIIAYEPIWAIGTGMTATNEQANEVIVDIRSTIAGIYGEMIAGEMRILYGGSMNAANALGLMNMSDIDGGLIGGASLKAEDFNVIIKASKGGIAV